MLLLSSPIQELPSLDGLEVFGGVTNWPASQPPPVAFPPPPQVAVPSTPPDADFQHPWPTQPVSSIEPLTELSAELPLPLGDIAAPQWTTVQPTPMVFQPNFDGRMEWPPAAYSPRTHFIYSHARYLPADFGITDSPDNKNCPLPPCTFTGTFDVPGVTNHGVYGAVTRVRERLPGGYP